MIKKSYEITGFDCAHCALKAEKHLNKNEKIDECVIDFSQNKIHLTFKDNEMSIPELLDVIAEVETDPIKIRDPKAKKEKSSIFNKDFWILLARVLFATAVILVCSLALEKAEYFYYVLALYAVGILVATYDVYWKVINHIIHKENPIDEFLLISICVTGAFTVAAVTLEPHFFMEALMVVTLFQIGKLIEGIATNKSKESIMKALDLRVDTANLLIGSVVKKVSPEELNIGDKVVVTTGEYIPVDSIVISGEGQVDTSSLTGEFVPVSASKDMALYSGFLLKEGTLTLKVTKKYEDSAISKIVELVSNSGSKKSKADEFVTKFARWYTPLVFLAALLTAIVGGAITSIWTDWIILGLKMLVVACPCAIVISVPLAYFASLGLASKHGIVIKGTNYLDKLNEMEKLVSDKTGTLTKGTFEITKVHPVGVKEEELLEILSSVEKLSKHPIGKAISKHHESKVSSTDFKEIAGKGISAKYENNQVFAGNSELLKENNIKFEEANEMGTIVYCAYNNKYIGYVVVSDELREDAKYLVNSLKANKVEMVLLTGDKENNAKEICHELGINKYHAELLPDQKNEYLEKELSHKYATGYIGDGINDAATIKRADIGFAMGAIGSDAAIESADVVIMNDDLSKLVDSLRIAKIARHTAIFNIIFALTVKIGVEVAAIVTSSLGHADAIPMWAAVLADTGLTVLLVINSLLILYRKLKRKGV